MLLYDSDVVIYAELTNRTGDGKNYRPEITDGCLYSIDGNTGTLVEGDLFVSRSLEGVDMIFSVVDAQNKNCQLGGKNPNKEDFFYKIGDKVEKITIPEYANGYKVVGIESYAFENNKDIKEVIIPDGVTYINSNAFKSCYNLASIKLSEALETIGEKAFYFANLTSVDFPKSLKSIGDNAFHDNDFTSIIFNESLQTIGESAFSSCHELKDVLFKGSVETIGKSAFSYCYELKDVLFNGSVETIMAEAFGSCSNLTSITFSKPIGKIENNAFWLCTSLNKIIINDIGAWCNVVFESSSANPLSIAHHLYSNSETEIIDLVIPEGVKSINSYAFEGCSSLTSVNIPSSLTTIGTDAFKGCDNLSKVTISDLAVWCGIKYDGYNSNCNPLSLAHHLYNADGTEITDLVIPEGMESINNYAFYGGSNFTSITIPSSLKKIGNSAFSGCNSLSKVVINDLAAWCSTSFDSNPLWYAHRLYNTDGTEIQDLTIPTGIKGISDNAFVGCSSLKSLVIPNGVEYIGYAAFADCSELATIVIPNSVKKIGSYAFANCMKLYSVTSLVNIPFKLDETAFEYVGSDFDKDIIYNVAKLYVPRGRGEVYGKSTGWMKFGDNIVEIDTKFKLTYIVDGAEYKTYEIQATEVITPEPDPFVEGYIFSGWSTIPKVMPANDVTVYGNFTVDPDYTGVESIESNEINPKDYYTIDGRRHGSQQKGLNIIRMNDGSTKKIVVKKK